MKKAPRISALVFGLTVLAAARFTPTAGAARGPAALTAEETWTIPGAGSAAGLNNTRFVSDLALTNLGSGTASVTVSFVGPGGLPPKPITLAAGSTTVYRDVLAQLWAATGLVGALSVRSDQPLVLRARTYNTAATGTFGVALPVYASADLLAEGRTADSIWVQQSASGSSGFRTNVGVVFPDAAGGDAVMTFYDANGAAVGTLNYTTATAGFQQQSIASVAPAGLPIGRAQISVTRGRAAGYAVGVDNVTGDTSLYPLEALPAGVQDVVVSGVARLNGRNNTFFRTDARFYNPTPADATVTARFHAGGSSNQTPQSATVTVPAGRVVEVVDVLGSILNLPVGSGGAVRFTADQPVAILCRTSNVDPQGIQPGTFGAQQRAVLLASYLSSADAGAVVTAIRQDASFRTNVGFAAGPDGATYRLTLKSAPGNSIASAVGSLGAFGWAQPSIADLFPGTAVPADATLLVEVTSGTVDVYDASLDNASGDLVVTPIAPVPAALPSSASIGPSGGSIRSADGRLTLKVPAGALATATTLAISSTANTAPNAVGSAYLLSPPDIAFARPAQLLLAYSDADLEGTGPGALGIASQNGSSSSAIIGGSVDPVARTLSVPVSSTSPAPQSTGGGQAALRARGPQSQSPYAAFKLDPVDTAVLVGGSKTILLTYVGPPSSGISNAQFPPISVRSLQLLDLTWSVNGVPGGNVAQGVISGQSVNRGEGTYTAPRCKPSTDPVVISVEVRETVPTASSPSRLLSPVIGARVRVLEKDWRIQVAYRSVSLCAGGPPHPGIPNYSVDYTRAHDGAFSINEQLQVVDYLPGLTHNNDQATVWCPPENGAGCTQPTMSQIGDLVLKDVTGTLNTVRIPFFVLHAEVEIPGTGATVTFICASNPPTTFVRPIFHGAEPTMIQSFLLEFGSNPPLRREIPYSYPGGAEYAIATVAPIKPSSCP